MRQKSGTPRRCLYALITFASVLAIIQFSTNISWSRAQNRKVKSKAEKTAEPNKERPLIPSRSTTGTRRASRSKSSQDPIEEPGEVTTVDISAVGPLSFDGDVRNLTPVPMDLTQREMDFEELLKYPETPVGAPDRFAPKEATTQAISIQAPAPGPIKNFAGLGRFDAVTGGQAGAGSPPDTNGDVGPNHYIQSVNSSYAIYDKATGARLAAFTENSLFSSGPTGTLCDTNSFGDPIVLYDQLADRWILTNFAFVLNAQGLWNPPIFQCFAASKTGDPVSGGWNLYAVRIDTGVAGQPPVGTLDDYPKFGIWNDGCLYMGANGFGSNGNFNGAIVGSFNTSDMYNGLTLRGALGRLVNSDSSLFPSNLLGRAPNQLPPSGTPNYFVRNASQTSFGVRRFTPGAFCSGGGVISATTAVSHASNGAIGGNIVPQPNTTRVLDSLGDRIMQKVQYRKIGSEESLWVVHNGRPQAGSNLRPQWAQINVTGGTVATTPIQQGFHAPDTTLFRWMASIATDTSGNTAIGYSTSNGTDPNFPSIAYAGRLVSDPLGTLPQTETQLIAGAGSQIFTCGGNPCARWGDYSSMSVDPVDDCTFWYTNQYYQTQAQGSNQPGIWQTRIGSFKFPSCVPIYPIITCPADITVNNDPGQCGAIVNFGSNVATATGNPTPTITYSQASGSFFPVGTTTVTATATNSFGTASCTFTVTVIDAESPVVSDPSPSLATLWPPNHRMVDVTVNYTATDNCPGLNCVLSVSSNEPVNGPGDGNTEPDWEIVDAHHLRLRAERAGSGTARIYTITLTCTDAAGHVVSKTTSVVVPHDN